MSASKTWFPTKYQHLYRHSSGTYYGRLSVAGKKTWRSLKTSVISIAKAKLDELFTDSAARVEMSDGAGVDEHLTGAQAIEIRKQQLANDVSIKPSTRRYWTQILKALEKKWPSLLDTELRTTTPAAVRRMGRKTAIRNVVQPL